MNHIRTLFNFEAEEKQLKVTNSKNGKTYVIIHLYIFCGRNMYLSFRTVTLRYLLRDGAIIMQYYGTVVRDVILFSDSSRRRNPCPISIQFPSRLGDTLCLLA